MSLPYRQRRRLRRLDRALCRTDPGLAGQLATFTRIHVGQAMPAREQLRGKLAGVRRVLLWPVSGAAFLVVMAAGGGASRARRTTGLSRARRDGPAPLSADG